ncbi:A disintegrin and metalloproteinase with thrombospondin motifs 5 [Heterocephalus glaber]|uniref:A disintegrin and metalloproteinase with thrombospondin motifs 5 n=1 Tax=Heterocephalus glaber TaxID=10181 RepID=G5C6W7_HETGA|nr:A disintegrin and metalloproteinase with thrombospondin motifs 5 [Heterocephalus glaber]EHB17278.1 A disintegrin and metalloproteinase with thrombospondin motifs 5 [Heterocephalus glaber]
MLLGWAPLLLCAFRLPLAVASPAAAPAQEKARQPRAAAAAAQPRQRQGEEAQLRVEPPGHPRALAPAPQHGSRGLVRNIDQLYSGGGKVGYLVYAGGRRFLLDLERDGSLGAAGFVPAGGGLSVPGQHGGHCFYRGTVDGSPRSLAVFDLCGGLQGFFAVKHARYTVKPLLRGPWAEAETGRVYGDGSARILHVYTREGFAFEALPPHASCETPASRPGPHKRPPAHNSPGRQAALAPQLPDQPTLLPAGDPGPQTWWRRRRRSISRARQVELLLVADASMAKMYGRGLQHYLLTLASIANRLYSHASIENHIRLAVVKVVVLGDKDKSLEVSKNAATTLKSFCKWQHQHNQLGDDHDEHYDAAILFTREDLCGHHSCDTLGMADVGTICSPERSCAVIEDDGLHAAFTVAHEIGHLLGLSHDDSKFCEENFGSTEDKRLMSSILTSIDASKPWSKCTSATITEFLDDGHGNCLLDLPRKQILGPEELPGQTYDATQQCNLTFGPEYSVCPGMDVCARLWCAVVRQGQMVCLTKKLPAVEGTPCGKGRICLQGKCVDKTKKKYYSTSSHGNWGSWGPWGQCSRSCGGGVQFAHRHCNNPAPRNSGRYCTGKRAIYRSCNVLPCPPNDKSFRHEQCEAKNGYQSDAKGVKTFVEWVPKYAGVLPGDVCKLTCRAKGTGYYVVFSPKVTDGTECRPYSNSVCVRGRCVRTGCDGIIGSKLQYDKCGVCGGDNSSCTKVIGTFNKKSKGYTDVVRIPEGATHIKVRQFKAKDQTRFTAYLALKKKSGEYLINGKYMISTSETIIDINGTVMNYSGWSHRDDFLHGMGYSATKEILIVQILATDPTKALDVRYSFFVPKKSTPAVNSVTSHGSNKVGLHTPQLQWVTGPWLACSRTCDTGWHTRTVQCQDGNRKLAKGCLLSQRPSAFKQCLLKKC